MVLDRASARTLILGTGPLARDLVREIRKRPDSGYFLLGVISAENVDVASYPDGPILGDLGYLPAAITTLRPDRIIVALPERRDYLPIHQLVEARVGKRIIVEDGEEVYERLTGKLAIESLTPSSIIFSRDFRPSGFTLAIARVASVVTALFGLIALAPVFVLIMLAIKIDSRGPVLFIQDRVGMEGRPFRLIKFRTMYPAEREHSEWARDNGDRITRMGRWLRRFRLDELPQFLNVLRGDMNIIGPRPHPLSNFVLFALVSRNTPACGGQIPYYSLRSMIRPGITGWAQVRYRYANDLDEEMEKMRYDLYYIKHYSIWLDLRIVFETMKVVLLGRAANAGDHAGAPEGASRAHDVTVLPPAGAMFRRKALN